MKKKNKLLFLLPLALLMFGCSKQTSKVKSEDKTTNRKTTNNTTLKKTTEKKTIKTTNAQTTTKEDVFDVFVSKSIDEAATIKGDGIFNLNSSTTIEIKLNYGYEFLGLFDGEEKLTNELTYDIKDINDNITLLAIFAPIKYNVTVTKDIEEAATVTGDGLVPYKTGTTINFTLDEEYIFLGLYDGEEELTTEPTYTIESVTKDINLTAKFKQKTYDVVVKQSLKNAAEIEGLGSFVKGSNTTIVINTNSGYNYLGLFDIDGNELTKDTTYTVENITENITFMASFSANQYDVVSGINDDELGEVTLISDSYDCGSEIELEVKPIDGYRLEGWYLNNELYAEDEKITFIVPAFDCEIIAKVVIKTFTVAITDNIDGLGRFYLNGYYYDSSEDHIYEYGELMYYYMDDVKGYTFDYLIINGEESDYCYNVDDIDVYENYVIEVYYKYAEMSFYMEYDRDRLQITNGISLDVLPTDFERGTNDGYSYISGSYTYQTTINITLNVKTNYYLDNLINQNDDEIVGSINGNVITLVIDDDYNNLLISILGKMCNITVKSKDDVTGLAYGTGEYHYGDYANILAVANKGYKFVKWVDEDGNDYGVIYGYEEDHAPADYDVPLYGDAVYVAVFVPDEFECYYMFVTDDETKTKNIGTMILTYLTEYEIEAFSQAGYTFVGWLENEDIDSLFSTDDVLNYTMTNEKSKIYAYYTPNTYNVTLDFNGGTGSITTMTALYDNEFITEIPTKEKYTFAGYYSYYNEKTYNIGEADAGKQLYFYIRYKERNYDWLITNGYMFINDIAVTDYNQTLQDGDVIKIVSHVSDNKVVNEKGIGTYNVAGDTKLVAKWMIGVLYLNYDKTPCYEEITLVEIGATAANYHCSKERDGYDYAYWTYNNERFDFDTPLTENITLVAYYQPHQHNLKITRSTGVDSYTVNGTTYSSTQTLIIDYDTILNISCTLSAGYTFSFWNNKTLDEKCYDKNLVFVMGDQDIDIVIKVMSYCLGISVNDSAYGTTNPSPTSYYFEYVSYGDSLTVTASANEGYAFEGWYNKDTNELLTNDAEYTFTPSEFDYDYTSGVNFKFYIKAVFGRVKTDKYERLGNKIWFGYYPQTCINGSNQSALIGELEEMAGGLPKLDTPENYESTKNNTEWSNYSSYYFYPGGSWLEVHTVINPDYSSHNEYTYLNAPHMWYIDIDYDGDGRYDYRGVVIYSHRNDEINEDKGSETTEYSHQDDNHYSSSHDYSIYWFKYELIEWDILENNDGTVKMIANLAIDSQNFSLSSNNYASSYIRSFLNDDFYNTAFSTLEKSIMSTMTIGSNNDYVTLLTEEEATTYFENNTDRSALSTDYAKSQNCYSHKPTSIYNPKYEGNCNWLTRSAYTESGKIYYVDYAGTLYNGKTNITYYGIRPVITINLNA